jgi:predicted DNA-binding protein with PD1-like motif
MISAPNLRGGPHAAAPAILGVSTTRAARRNISRLRIRFCTERRLKLRSKLLQRDGGATYAVVFDTGDEIMSGLTTFAKDQGLDASDFTALGAFSSSLLGYFDVERKEYRKIPVEEQAEVLSLVGNITIEQGAPKVHAHVVLGLADGTTRGGHVLEAHARPTLELVLVESPVELRRKFDEKTGLALISL